MNLVTLSQALLRPPSRPLIIALPAFSSQLPAPAKTPMMRCGTPPIHASIPVNWLITAFFASPNFAPNHEPIAAKKPTIRPGMPANQAHTACHAFLTLLPALTKNPVIIAHTLRMNEVKPVHSELSVLQKSCHICFPRFVWVKNHTNPATRPAIRPITRPMGLASIAELSSSCATCAA